MLPRRAFWASLGIPGARTLTSAVAQAPRATHATPCYAAHTMQKPPCDCSAEYRTRGALLRWPCWRNVITSDTALRSDSAPDLFDSCKQKVSCLSNIHNSGPDLEVEGCGLIVKSLIQDPFRWAVRCCVRWCVVRARRQGAEANRCGSGERILWWLPRDSSRGRTRLCGTQGADVVRIAHVLCC